MNEIVERIELYREKRGWSVYKLSQESEVPAPTIRQWIQKKDMYPSVPLLMQICDAFGITLGELFTQNNLVELNDERKALFDKWLRLTKVQRIAILSHIDGYLG